MIPKLFMMTELTHLFTYRGLSAGTLLPLMHCNICIKGMPYAIIFWPTNHLELHFIDPNCLAKYTMQLYFGLQLMYPLQTNTIASSVSTQACAALLAFLLLWVLVLTEPHMARDLLKWCALQNVLSVRALFLFWHRLHLQAIHHSLPS